MKTAIIHARIEPQTKKKAENVLKQLGISSTEAIRMFYKQICLKRGLPFLVQIPNSTTQKTINQAQNKKNVQSFDSLDDMFDD